MRGLRVLGVLLLLLFGVVPNALSYTVDDVYWGAQATHRGKNYQDVISANDPYDYNLFNILGMDVSFSGGFMNVKVYTGFYEPPVNSTVWKNNTYGTLFGDLFISTNGWDPTGTAAEHYINDNASNGGWEFVFDTSENKLYGGGFNIVLSQDAPPKADRPSMFIVRDGQEVYRKDGGVAYAGDGSSVDLSHVATGLFSAVPDPFPYYLEYHISLTSLGIVGGETIGLKWGMSCANDTIEGAVMAPVPEPGTFILLGLGLVGLVWFRRQKAIN